MKLLFATANPNKFSEILELLPTNIELLSLNDIDLKEELPETQNSIEGNARQKAEYIAKNFYINCFADDTGLEVNALDGAPGVHSAYYGGPERSAQKNMDKVLKELAPYSDRTAQFKTVISLFWEGKFYEFIGILQGTITNTKKGNNGFGYDPIFKPSNNDLHLAELSSQQKNNISHRAKAFNKLMNFLQKQG